MARSRVTTEDVSLVLDQVYAWSGCQGYRGYNKHDALNSPALRALLGWAKWPRIVAIQAVMRLPLNVRPLLGVPKTYNPKGLALFAQGLFDRFRTHGGEEYLDEAERLLQRLLDLRSQGSWSGNCWGYLYPWQDPGFFAPTGMPNAVVTSFVCEAMLDAYRITGRTAYLDVVSSAIEFLLNDLTVLKETDSELCLSYMPVPMTMRVMDVSMLIGAVISQYVALSGDTKHNTHAYRLANYVVNRQTSYGAWFYTDPPGDSPIRHDNYHTGFILDALSRYMAATSNDRWSDIYDLGLTFYADKLFNKDGTPRWTSDRDYPHDIHGAAQGILTFTGDRAAGRYLPKAVQIASWAISYMYQPAGRFYYQETRHFRKRFTLLRWCNAWMARALAKLEGALSRRGINDSD